MLKDPHRPIVFVAHSMGGLVVLEFLIQAKLDDSALFGCTKALIFFGVPHAGSRVASLVNSLGTLCNLGTLGYIGVSDHINQLERSSSTVKDITAHFSLLSQKFAIASFIETKGRFGAVKVRLTQAPCPSRTDTELIYSTGSSYRQCRIPGPIDNGRTHRA